MPSTRSRVAKCLLKSYSLLRNTITAENLEKKRNSYNHLANKFRMPKDTKITPVKRNEFMAEWVETPCSRQNIVMLYMHGGGFVFDSTKLHRELIARIARAARVRALSLDYSLAPENPYPIAINEALAAYIWLLGKFSPEGIVLAGDSAGGSMVLSLLHIIHNKKLPNPACAIAVSPATDAYNVDEAVLKSTDKDFFINAKNLKFFIDAYFQQTPRNHPIASPYFGSLKGFPPLLIHADRDELFNIGIKRFVEKAKKEKVDVTFYEEVGLWHVWHLFARYIPEARDAIEQIGLFIQRHTEDSFLKDPPET